MDTPCVLVTTGRHAHAYTVQEKQRKRYSQLGLLLKATREVFSMVCSIARLVGLLHRCPILSRHKLRPAFGMIYLFDLAKRLGALVCGTENRTEQYLGYFTRFGDEASDLEPIRSLYKTQVWELARALNLPPQIIQQAPTADLWEDQTDEEEWL